MATFVLIPGAWHGAWCWDRLVPELEDRGHSAVAVDLPCDDKAAGFERYVEVTGAPLDAAHSPFLSGPALLAATMDGIARAAAGK